MLRNFVFAIVVTLIISTTSFAGNYESVTTRPTMDGQIAIIIYDIDDGPSTDCDRIMIESEARIFINGYSVEKVREFRHNLISRGIPIRVYNVVIGNIFDPFDRVAYDTTGL